MTQRYPLHWPLQRPRTPTYRRKDAPFGKRVQGVGNSTDLAHLSVRDALERLQAEVDRLGAKDVILSSNVELRLDGWPRSDRGNPSDPGVALYFSLKGKAMCLPCDTFNRVADNIAALAAHIEATRKIERYGVASVSEMFTGFEALPAPGAKRSWRDILGFNVDRPGVITKERIDGAYRLRAQEAHPDKPGGSHEAMAELNRAREEALREVQQ